MAIKISFLPRLIVMNLRNRMLGITPIAVNKMTTKAIKPMKYNISFLIYITFIGSITVR